MAAKMPLASGVFQAPPRPSAWVLDTDLGWDPDDVLALLLMSKLCATRNEPLAVISSDETPEGLRARALQRALAQHDGGAPVFVAAGACAPQTRHAVPPALAKLVSDDTPVTLGVKDIAAFICQQRAFGAFVSWVGIGPMTNLAQIMQGDEQQWPDRIVQMGGALPYEPRDSEYNIRLDPNSCKAVLGICGGVGLGRVSIGFVPLDTTGTHPSLSWVNNHPDADAGLDVSDGRAVGHDHTYDALNRLVRSQPSVGGITDFKSLVEPHASFSEVLAANLSNAYTERLNKRSYYWHTSALHDPMTVLAAHGHVHFDTSIAKIECDGDGVWTTTVPEEAFACAVARSKLEKEGTSTQLVQFWRNQNADIYRAQRSTYPVKTFLREPASGGSDDSDALAWNAVIGFGPPSDAHARALLQSIADTLQAKDAGTSPGTGDAGEMAQALDHGMEADAADVQMSFADWIMALLVRLDIDIDVYVPYVVGIMEEDDDSVDINQRAEEASEMLIGIVENAPADITVVSLANEIASRYRQEQTLKSGAKQQAAESKWAAVAAVAAAEGGGALDEDDGSANDGGGLDPDVKARICGTVSAGGGGDDVGSISAIDNRGAARQATATEVKKWNEQKAKVRKDARQLKQSKTQEEAKALAHRLNKKDGVKEKNKRAGNTFVTH